MKREREQDEIKISRRIEVEYESTIVSPDTREREKKKKEKQRFEEIFKPDVIPSARHPPRFTRIVRDTILAVDEVITFINRTP